MVSVEVLLTSVVSKDMSSYIGDQWKGASYISGETHYISEQDVPLTFVVNVRRSPSTEGVFEKNALIT